MGGGVERDADECFIAGTKCATALNLPETYGHLHDLNFMEIESDPYPYPVMALLAIRQTDHSPSERAS